eukprot:2091818-Rhodomonas_salina.1
MTPSHAINQQPPSKSTPAPSPKTRTRHHVFRAIFSLLVASRTRPRAVATSHLARFSQLTWLEAERSVTCRVTAPV